ncbi:hypothetical protein ACWGII_00405 [Streptomyces sp. NPDC054855]
MNQHAVNQHAVNQRPTDIAVGCGPCPSLGEIGLLIVTTASLNLALTGRRTAELRSRQALRTRQANDNTTPGSH